MKVLPLSIITTFTGPLMLYNIALCLLCITTNQSLALLHCKVNNDFNYLQHLFKKKY